LLEHADYMDFTAGDGRAEHHGGGNA